MIVRKANIKDVKTVVELAVGLIEYHSNFDLYFEPSKDAKNVYIKYFKKFIKSPKNFLLVAEEDGEIVGFSSGEIKKGPAMFKIRFTGTLEYMYIKKEFRKQDVGDMMFKMLMDWFKKKKIGYVVISVHTKNDIGNSFWKKNGFVEFMSKQRIFIKK
jgi:ribosomal protein S18 acetylase RimI-like enzyme